MNELYFCFFVKKYFILIVNVGVKYSWKLLVDDMLKIKFIIFCKRVVFLE